MANYPLMSLAIFLTERGGQPGIFLLRPMILSAYDVRNVKKPALRQLSLSLKTLLQPILKDVFFAVAVSRAALPGQGASMICNSLNLHKNLVMNLYI